MTEKQAPPFIISDCRAAFARRALCVWRTSAFNASIAAGFALNVVFLIASAELESVTAQVLAPLTESYAPKNNTERRFFLRRFIDMMLGREPEAESVDVLPVPDGLAYSVNFDIPKGSSAEQLKSVSELERLQKQLPSGAAGIIARARIDKGRLISALEALGFYDGQVDIMVAGLGLDNPVLVPRIESLRQAGPIPVRVKIFPGEKYVFGRLALIDVVTQQPLPSPDWGKLGIKPGDPALSASVLDAETALIEYFRGQGYAKARVPARQATVDHSSRSMDIVFHVAVGTLAKFGPVTVSAPKNIETDFILKRVPFKEGDVFAPEALARLRRALSAYDAFDSVRIIESNAFIANDELPIEIRVGERLPRFIGLSAKYSTSEGVASNVYWGHRNLFGGAERLRLDAQISGASIHTINGRSRARIKDKLGYRIGGSFFKPGIFTVKDDLVVEAAGLKEVTKTYTRQGLIGSVGVKRSFSDTLSGQAGLDIERAKFTAPAKMHYDNSEWYTLIGAPLKVNYDNTGDPLNPTKGVKLSGKVVPYPAFLGSSVDMTSVDAVLSGYMSLDDIKRYVIAARVRFGSIIGPALPNIPPPHRFFAGGGGSVRGYGYQSLGPTDTSGYVIGGRSLFEGSAEMRVKITDTIGVVAFADTGMAFRSSIPSFDENLRYAAGLGVRYFTAIGPIRFDVARGLNRKPGDSPYGLYISLGQTF